MVRHPLSVRHLCRGHVAVVNLQPALQADMDLCEHRRSDLDLPRSRDRYSGALGSCDFGLLDHRSHLCAEQHPADRSDADLPRDRGLAIRLEIAEGRLYAGYIQEEAAGADHRCRRSRLHRRQRA